MKHQQFFLGAVIISALLHSCVSLGSSSKTPGWNADKISLENNKTAEKLINYSQNFEPWFLTQVPEWEGLNFLVIGDKHMGFAFHDRSVLFYYLPRPQEPTPKTVVAAGSYQGWNPRGRDGVLTRKPGREIWTYEAPNFGVSLDPDYGGTLYKFVVDGEWIDECSEIVKDLGLYDYD